MKTLKFDSVSSNIQTGNLH